MSLLEPVGTHYNDIDAVPRKHYRVIYADPAWTFSGGKKSRPQHYPRMTLPEIKALPVKDLAHPDGCRLLMWITAPLLNRTEEVLRAYGFKYCSCRTWIKLNPRESGGFIYRDSLARGTGYEVAGNAEFLIIAKRGKPQSIKGRPWTSFIIDNRGEHSRKPDSVRAEIRSMLDGPRLEMNARSSSPGFDCWGNQTRMFDEVAA